MAGRAGDRQWKGADEMVRKGAVFGVLCGALLAASGSIARAEHHQVPVMRLHAQTEIAAPPAAVWAWMTQGRNLVTWCPQWKAAANAKATLTKVGDVLDYTDEWGNGGRSVVTYLSRGKELRVAHEPSRGDYMCQAKFVLEPAGAGTRVHLWDQYTDESSPTDMQATAQKMETELAGTLAALKRGVEGK
jgi:polyketide cyclase/dehydrase/lipid transport protein